LHAKKVRANKSRAFDLLIRLVYRGRVTQEERIINIEANLAHVEQTLESLSQTIVEQDRTIQQLQAYFAKLATTAESQEMDKIEGTIKKPPHYQ